MNKKKKYHSIDGENYRKIAHFEPFEKTRCYFQSKRDIHLVTYEVSDGGLVVNTKTDLHKDLHRCSICDKELYNLRIDKSTSPFQFHFETKKHFRFLSSNGKFYHTCHRMAHCFKVVNWTYSEDEVILPKDDAPSFEEFINYGGDIDEESSFIQYAKESYENNVLPFIKRWRFQNIDKSNFLMFNHDLNISVSPYLLFYDEKGSAKALKKIYFLVGIRN